MKILKDRGIEFERYEGFDQDENGILDMGNGRVAWFTRSGRQHLRCRRRLIGLRPPGPDGFGPDGYFPAMKSPAAATPRRPDRARRAGLSCWRGPASACPSPASPVGLVVVAMLVIPGIPIGRTPDPELARRLLVVTTFPIRRRGFDPAGGR